MDWNRAEIVSFHILGCPIYYCRKKKKHFEGLMKKTSGRILSWKSKLLTAGERYILIKHVLQSIPIYQLSVMNPPKSIVNHLHKMIANFFWGECVETSGKHWVAWDRLCCPPLKGGIGYGSLQYMVDVLFAKLW